MVENRASQITAVAVTFIALTWISTLLRCFVRIYVVKHFGSDDYFAVASLATFTVFQVFVLWGVAFGSGQHIANVELADIPMALKQWYFAEIFYDIATTLTKFTIGIFLLRLSVKPVHTWIIRLVLGIITAYATAYMGLIVFQCQPIDYYWLRFAGVPGGHCARNVVIIIPTYVHTALNAFADWTLGILPIFIIKDLDMNPRTKVTIAVILALGGIGSIASLIRLKYIDSLVQTDFLYDATDIAIWSTVEPGMGITAASLATLRPIFNNFLAHTRFGSSSNKTLSTKKSHTSYMWSGKKKTSTVYTAENLVELGDYIHSPIDVRGDRKIDYVDMGEGVGKIVQSQAHADEEEAQIRKKELARNRPVSWGNMGRSRERERGGSRSRIDGTVADLDFGFEPETGVILHGSDEEVRTTRYWYE